MAGARTRGDGQHAGHARGTSARSALLRVYIVGWFSASLQKKVPVDATTRVMLKRGVGAVPIFSRRSFRLPTREVICSFSWPQPPRTRQAARHGDDQNGEKKPRTRGAKRGALPSAGKLGCTWVLPHLWCRWTNIEETQSASYLTNPGEVVRNLVAKNCWLVEHFDRALRASQPILSAVLLVYAGKETAIFFSRIQSTISFSLTGSRPILCFFWQGIPSLGSSGSD